MMFLQALKKSPLISIQFIRKHVDFNLRGSSVHTNLSTSRKRFLCFMSSTFLFDIIMADVHVCTLVWSTNYIVIRVKLESQF